MLTHERGSRVQISIMNTPSESWPSRIVLELLMLVALLLIHCDLRALTILLQTLGFVILSPRTPLVAFFVSRSVQRFQEQK